MFFCTFLKFLEKVRNHCSKLRRPNRLRFSLQGSCSNSVNVLATLAPEPFLDQHFPASWTRPRSASLSAGKTRTFPPPRGNVSVKQQRDQNQFCRLLLSAGIVYSFQSPQRWKCLIKKWTQSLYYCQDDARGVMEICFVKPLFIPANRLLWRRSLANAHISRPAARRAGHCAYC